MVHVHRGSDHGIDSVMLGAPFRLCLFPICESGSPGLDGAGAGGGFGTRAAWYSVRLLRIHEGEWSRRLSFLAGSVSGDSAGGLRILLYSWEQHANAAPSTRGSGCAFSCTLGNGRGLALSVPGETEAGACSRASNSREGAITRSSRWTESTRRRGSCVIRPVSCEICEERLTASLPSTPSG
jgi:hypothetical protein